ncbi:MAG: carboxypeptidase-like regulatory domain-containing protein [Planctomycetota bacterium]
MRLVPQDDSVRLRPFVRFENDGNRTVVAMTPPRFHSPERVDLVRRAVLPPGAWTLLVSAPGYREKSLPVRVEEGAPQELVIRLEPQEGPK